MKLVSEFNVGLFIPCYIDQFYPQVGIATLELLQKLGLDVYYPLKQTCCGQPMANSGAEKEHYNILEQTDEVKKVRENTFELCEFIVDILKMDDLKIEYPHKVGIHQSCHGLRGLKLGTSSELVAERSSKVHRLLEKAKGIEIINLDREDECCGFGGTFSVFQPDVSVSMGKDRLNDHLRNGVEIITATDMSCLMHLEGIARRQNHNLKAVHIAKILNSNHL
jgi:L-lactate dehydrogenase complex protein LldE